MNLASVDTSLRRLQQHYAGELVDLAAGRDPLDDRVIDNMMAGYTFVDTLVGEGIDVFAMGHHRHLLEMNTIVLCGTSPARRALYAGTSRRPSDVSTRSGGGHPGSGRVVPNPSG
jgi:hypothetical protein